MKNRFQSLPFKCNLQRYSAVAAVELIDPVVLPLGGGLVITVTGTNLTTVELHKLNSLYP